MVNWDWRWLTVGPEMVNCGTGDGLLWDEGWLTVGLEMVNCGTGDKLKRSRGSCSCLLNFQQGTRD